MSDRRDDRRAATGRAGEDRRPPGGAADRATRERATVVRVGDGSVTVRCGPAESCGSCSSLLCSPRERTYEAVVDDDRLNGTPLAAGDVVEIQVPETRALGKAALLFAAPLALFVVGYVLFGFTESETQRVAAGFVGLAAGFALAMLVSRWIPEPRPTVIAVYRQPELEPARVSSPGSTS